MEEIAAEELRGKILRALSAIYRKYRFLRGLGFYDAWHSAIFEFRLAHQKHIGAVRGSTRVFLNYCARQVDRGFDPRFSAEALKPANENTCRLMITEW